MGRFMVFVLRYICIWGVILFFVKYFYKLIQLFLFFQNFIFEFNYDRFKYLREFMFFEELVFIYKMKSEIELMFYGLFFCLIGRDNIYKNNFK